MQQGKEYADQTEICGDGGVVNRDGVEIVQGGGGVLLEGV